MDKKVSDSEKIAALRDEIEDLKKKVEHTHAGTDRHGVGPVAEVDPAETWFRANYSVPIHGRLTILRSKLEGDNDLAAKQLNIEEKTDIWTGDLVRENYARALRYAEYTTGSKPISDKLWAAEVWVTRWLNYDFHGRIDERGLRATTPMDVVNVRAAVGDSLKDQALKMEVFEDSLRAFIKANASYITLLEQK